MYQSQLLSIHLIHNILKLIYTENNPARKRLFSLIFVAAQYEH